MFTLPLPSYKRMPIPASFFVEKSCTKTLGTTCAKFSMRGEEGPVFLPIKSIFFDRFRYGLEYKRNQKGGLPMPRGKKKEEKPKATSGISAELLDEDGTLKKEGNACRVEVIAALFGVSVRRVQQLKQEGILATTPAVINGRRVNGYELVPTIQKYIQHLSDKANGRGGGLKERELKEQKLIAEIALKESQAELHQMKTEIAAGKFISVGEVVANYERFFQNFKKFALSIPNRVGGMIAGHIEPVEARSIERDIQQEVYRALNDFVIRGVVDTPPVGENGKKNTSPKI